MLNKILVALIGVITGIFLYSLFESEEPVNRKAVCVHEMIRNPSTTKPIPECVPLSEREKREIMEELLYFIEMS